MVQYLIWAFMFFLFMERDCQCFHRHLSIFSMVSTFADGSDTRTLQAPCRHSGGDLALLTDWFWGFFWRRIFGAYICRKTNSTETRTASSFRSMLTISIWRVFFKCLEISSIFFIVFDLPLLTEGLTPSFFFLSANSFICFRHHPILLLIDADLTDTRTIHS